MTGCHRVSTLKPDDRVRRPATFPPRALVKFQPRTTRRSLAPHLITRVQTRSCAIRNGPSSRSVKSCVAGRWRHAASMAQICNAPRTRDRRNSTRSSMPCSISMRRRPHPSRSRAGQQRGSIAGRGRHEAQVKMRPFDRASGKSPGMNSGSAVVHVEPDGALSSVRRMMHVMRSWPSMAGGRNDGAEMEGVRC